LNRPWEEVAEEGAQQMTDYLTAQGFDLPQDFPERWLAARVFAERKANEEQEEMTANQTLAFLLRLHSLSNVPQVTIHTAVDVYFEPELAAWTPFDDAVSTLAELSSRHYRLGIISNASCDRLVQRIVDRCGIRSYLDVIVSSAAVKWRKPRVEIFRFVLGRWDLLPYEVVMVGDMLGTDIRGAQETGMLSILMANRSHPDNENHADVHPDATITRLQDAIPIIERWTSEARIRIL